jgi:hypothetical protein
MSVDEEACDVRYARKTRLPTEFLKPLYTNASNPVLQLEIDDAPQSSDLLKLSKSRNSPSGRTQQRDADMTIQVPQIVVYEADELPKQGKSSRPVNSPGRVKSSKLREEQVDKLLKNKAPTDFKGLMTEYLKRLGLPEDTKVFALSSQDKHIRQALKARGWAENCTSGSKAFHLKWVNTDSELDYKALLPGQRFNHFPNNRELTTKSGLCQHLSSVSSVNISVDRFFPRCYDLGNSKQVKAFIKDYEQSAILGIVKHAGESRQGSDEVVRLALKYAAHIVSRAEDMCELRTQYSFVPDFSTKFSFSRAEVLRLMGYRPEAQKLAEDLVGQCRGLTRRICLAYPQAEVDGCTNLWIIKPSQNARGSGIRCVRDLQEVLDCGSQLQARVIQKYIERPFLLNIEGKSFKFDIRQWVLVTSWEPLELYVFDACYLRVCQEEFSLEDIANLYRHLTNYSIQKSVAKSQEATVWSSLQFSTYLEALGHRWEAVCSRLHRVILDTIEGLSEAVEHKEGCFEVYGFDVLLDERLSPWLLEVNLSPACAAGRAPWLAEMLRQMGEGLLRIVLKEDTLEPLYSASCELVRCPTYHTNAWLMLVKAQPQTSSEVTGSLEVVGRAANIRAERRLDRSFLTDQAARLLQRYGRGFLERRRLRHQVERKAVTVIQCCIRMSLAQRHREGLRRDRAAVQIQTRVRAWRARRLTEHLRKVSVLTKLQSWYRGRQARRLCRHLRQARCALVIQKTFRRLEGFKARRDREAYLGKVRVIQGHWRRCWALRNRSAATIQNWYRGVLGQRLQTLRQKKSKSAVTIQSWLRSLQAQAQLVSLKRAQAATKIQSFIRMIRAKQTLRRLVETQAVVLIQSHYRAHRSKQIGAALNKLSTWRVSAASHIQRVMRGHIDRLKFDQRRRVRAAVVIQTAFRRHKTHQRLMRLVVQNQAATKIQAFVKGRVIRMKFLMMKSTHKLRAERPRRRGANDHQERVQSTVDRLAYRRPSFTRRGPSLSSAKAIMNYNRLPKQA